MAICILVASASEACFYSSENQRFNELSLVEKIEHPESRMKGSDLISDRPGHYQTDHQARSAYEKGDPKAIEAENFAIELANKLKDYFTHGNYESLMLVVLPHFYGVMKKHLHLSNVDIIHIPKDYTKLSLEALMDHLQVR